MGLFLRLLLKVPAYTDWYPLPFGIVSVKICSTKEYANAPALKTGYPPPIFILSFSTRWL
ncbi:hypothetical protein TUM4433_06620 [Shewanella schlegeliana]|nr:hypothetical protein TUM4433_06620 [Shewanella schlegeliana]